MKCGCIYIIRNTANSKVYVGKTIRNIGERQREHRSRLRTGNSRPFYQAMIKDGVTEISLEVIESDVAVELLKEREAYHMDQYDSVTNGYNHYKGNRFDLPVKEIADLYRYGITLKEIGKMYGVDRDAVALRVAESGVKTRDWNKKQYIEGLTEDVLKDLYLDKWLSTREIAEMYHTSSATVSKRLRKYNIPVRPFVNRKYLK